MFRFQKITILHIIYIHAHWIKSVKIMRYFFGEYILQIALPLQLKFNVKYKRTDSLSL